MNRFILSVLLLSAATLGSAQAEPVIIKCTRPCTAAINAIQSNGGTVTHRYKYVDAIAAEVNDSALSAVRKKVGAGAVRKDLVVPAPGTPTDLTMVEDVPAESGSAMSAESISSLAGANPDAYLINNALMNLGPLHGAGAVGSGQVVAVIDSGIRPGRPHLDLDGSVIGGEDFVGDGLGYSHPNNGGHGTFVAGMISSNVVFNFNPTTPLLLSVQAHCPGCVVNGTQIPLIGSAPSSSIYALRVFAPTGGAPESRIIAAMERVLEMKDNYLSGQPETANPNGSYDSLNVKVCNMSLGGSTLYAGRDIEDQLTNVFNDLDIVLVTSAGNNGPSGSTGGSPGTGFASLTVGAASTPVHERVLRDIQFGLGIGSLYRPFSGIQMAYFSSRGPTADGRPDPEVVANGFASIGQGFSNSVNGISLSSGTSFSSPTVAGVAAILREAVPNATALEVRNAIIEGANAGLLADGSGPMDQGNGFVDGGAALALLQNWMAADTAGPAGGTNKNVKVNISQGAGIQTHSGNVTRNTGSLLPGQRFETYYKINPNTAAVVVTLSNVVAGSPQNALFGDDILLTVHSAKTSSVGASGDYNVFSFTLGESTVIPNPDLGLMRVTVSGDWTNASPIAATISIQSINGSEPGLTAQSKISDGQFFAVPFTVPAGTGELKVRAEWDGDWGNYPTNDLDVILVDPFGNLNFDGATLNVPERATISSPVAGTWTAFVDGFTVHTSGGDRFKLLVTADGVRLKK